MYVNNGLFSLIFTFVIIIVISVLRIRRSIQGTKVSVKKTIVFSAYLVAITSFLVYNSFLIGSVAVLYVIPYFAVVTVTISYSYIQREVFPFRSYLIAKVAILLSMEGCRC